MGGGDDRIINKTTSRRRNDLQKVEKSYFEVLGICCTSEVPIIEKILKALVGVMEVKVIVPSKTVIVLHDPLLVSHLHIANALNKSGLEASLKVSSSSNDGNKKKVKDKWPSPFVIGSGILVLLSLILQHAYHPLRYMALGAVALAIFPIFFKAVAALRIFNISNINILVLIAVGGSIVLKDYIEAGTIVFLFTIAQWLETKASHRATATMSSLANIVPQTAVIAASGERVNADQVNLNTILSIKPGDVIPIDGVVVHGNSDVDEKTLTGESFPVSKQIHSTVWAGTININGHLSVNTTALAQDCVVAKMASLVEEAQNAKSRTQRIIERCTKYYTPIIIAISLGLVILPSALRARNLRKWYRLALVVLVSACPCALVLSTPVAAFCALSSAAKSGLLVKGAEHLETLAKVKIIAFDKTGTITIGEFVVGDFKSLLQEDDHISLNKLLYWVASIESKSSHPMAEALVKYAKSYSVEPKPDEVEEFHNFPGEGICGKIDGKDIYIGNRKIAIRAGCATLPIVDDDAMEGKSIGYIFSGSVPAGIFSLSDVCRTGVIEAIQELKSMGIKTAMLTGDSQAAAKHAQDQIGGALELVHAELLPEDKARIIRDFQNDSVTAMIGDGLNDAAALATADIGISMGISGSALAMETGNMILMSNDIRKIPQAVRLARKTKRKILENIFLSIITKIAIIVLAIMGHPLVWAAVLADVGTCLLVICNSMLLLAREDKHHKGCFKFFDSAHDHKHGCKTARSHKHCCSSIETGEKHEHKKICAQSQSSTALAQDDGCCGHDHDHQSSGVQHNVGVSESHSSSQHCCSSIETGEKHEHRKICAQSQSSTALAQDDGCCGHDHDHQSSGVQHNVGISESHSSSQHCCPANQVETKLMPPHNSSSPKHHCKSLRSPPKSCKDIKPLTKTHGCCEHKDDNDDDDDKLEKGKEMEHGSHGGCEHGDHIVDEEAMTNNNVGICEEKCMDSSGHGCCSSSSGSEHTSSQHEKSSSSIIVKHQQQHVESCPPADCRRILSSSNKNCNNIKHCENDECAVVEEEYINQEDARGGCCNHHHDIGYSSLQVRHVGGCCKSFRKECCGNNKNIIHPHFGVGFRGGLSEIVIE